jgi:plastocyanin
MARLSRFAKIAIAPAMALGFSSLPAGAGEVSGRVVLPPPAAIEASFGVPSPLGTPDARAASPVVLVYVAESEGELPRTASSGAVVRLGGGRVIPALIAVSLGSAITFENADRRTHRIRSKSGPWRFDLGRQPRGESRELTPQETGIISFRCALHDDVRGEIVVLAHSAFAMVDASGAYHLPDVPPGRATIVAYAPALGEASRQVVIEDGKAVEIEFAF